MTNAILRGKPDAGNPHVRFDEGEVASAKPRRGSLLYKTIEILGFKAKVARTFWERTRGLIGTKSLAPDEGLLIEKCNAIHMCFMSFPIDAYFLDKDDKVVKVVRDIPPWKLFVWGGWRATKVLETAIRT